MSDEMTTAEATPAETPNAKKKPGRKPPVFPKKPEVAPTPERMQSLYRNMKASLSKLDQAHGLVRQFETESQGVLAAFTRECGKGPFEIKGVDYEVTEDHVAGEVVLRWGKKQARAKASIDDSDGE